MKRTIVKVQVPLILSEDTPCALVYDEGRKNQGYLPVDDFLLTAMEWEPKKYFYAAFNKEEVTIFFNKPAPWQDW